MKQMSQTVQQFFIGFEKKLWITADTLRASPDASAYKSVARGVNFLKRISNALEGRQKELREQFQNPAMNDTGYAS